jgi:hypothetical protein
MERSSVGATSSYQAKIDQFPKDKTLIIIDKITIKPYLEYVEKAYGKNFVEILED